jgi:hypothetical protein
MPNLSSLPAEITLQIIRCTFWEDDYSDLAVGTGVSRQVHYSQRKRRWDEISGVMCASHSMRQFALQFWFSTLVLRKTSDLTDGIGLFPNLSSWVQ